MKIEVGKKYVDRCGTIVEIVHKLPEPDTYGSQYVGVTRSSLFLARMYREDGTLLIGEDITDYDLVDEYNQWYDFKDGDPVMVRDKFSTGKWVRRHFSFAEDGVAYCYGGGKTNWTSEGVVDGFYECRRPTEEELGETK